MSADTKKREHFCLEDIEMFVRFQIQDKQDNKNKDNIRTR